MRNSGRLIDSYVDAHKYVFGKAGAGVRRAGSGRGIGVAVGGDRIVPALLPRAEKSGRLREQIVVLEPDLHDDITALEGADFAEIEAHAAGEQFDLAIGNSKGYGFTRKLQIPLIRVCFPVHDRWTGRGCCTSGYPGAQQLFDRIVMR